MPAAWKADRRSRTPRGARNSPPGSFVTVANIDPPQRYAAGTYNSGQAGQTTSVIKHNHQNDTDATYFPESTESFRTQGGTATSGFEVSTPTRTRDYTRP